MKDSVRRVFDVGVTLALSAAVLSLAGCAKSNQTADVAQDSMLVKDVDIAEHKTDTTAPGTTLVRDRGSAADAPTLTNGAPVKRSVSGGGGAGRGGLQPPTRVNPIPVLPGRDSTSSAPQPPRIDPMVGPEPTRKPVPVSQPVPPQPPTVLQPSPAPKTDSLGPAQI